MSSFTIACCSQISDGGGEGVGEGGEGGTNYSSAITHSQLPVTSHDDQRTTKKRKTQPSKFLHRLKHRNKTVPVSEDIPLPPPPGALPTSLANAPPLLAPWVSSDMVLEQEAPPSELPATKGVTAGKGIPFHGTRLPKLPATNGSSNQEDNLPQKGLMM